MSINTAMQLSKKSQDGLCEFHKNSLRALDRQYNFREQMRQMDLAYLREKDLTQEHLRARQANKAGNSDKLQNITVPVIKPAVDMAVDYQAAVFLTDYPIFGVISDPANIDAAKSFQAVIEENSIRCGWNRELLLFFQRAFRYNLAALECSWDKIITAAVETDPTFRGGKEGKPKQIIWQGNRLKSWDMYNTYWDTRCLPYDIPDKAEFVGHTELMSKTALKTFIAQLDTKLLSNIIPAFNSPTLLGAASGESYSYYLPDLNPDALLGSVDRLGEDWDVWMGNLSKTSSGREINYKNLYEVTTEYVRIMPAEFDIRVPAPNTPQIWKLIWVNHSVLIYAERQTNAHEKIPVFFAQPAEDGLGYQSKSLAKDAEPFQDVASALMNSVLAGRRRAATDRVLYDPSRISEAQINNPNPSAKIPVRPAAYGKPVSEAVFPFPFRDDQAGLAMQEIQAVVNFGNVLNGANPARQGQFVKGNKTDGQWDTVMQNATSKDQRTALLFEAQIFTPLKEVIKLNILQFQQPGTVFSPTQQQAVPVDPLTLRQAVLNFKVTDGLTPAEKVISADALKISMQVIGSSPQIGGAYNIGPLFSYIMKTENVNLTPFEKGPAQQTYEQAVNNWMTLAQMALQKGVPFSTPQPIPQQYGYDPNMQNPANQQTPGSATPATQ
jgi:hypothetical protein